MTDASLIIGGRTSFGNSRQERLAHGIRRVVKWILKENTYSNNTREKVRIVVDLVNSLGALLLFDSRLQRNLTEAENEILLAAIYVSAFGAIAVLGGSELLYRYQPNPYASPSERPREQRCVGKAISRSIKCLLRSRDYEQQDKEIIQKVLKIIWIIGLLMLLISSYLGDHLTPHEETHAYRAGALFGYGALLAMTLNEGIYRLQ